MIESKTCACYKDDDGLHLCDESKAKKGTAGYYKHVIEAFELYLAPEKPKLLLKARCGCVVDYTERGTEYFTETCQYMDSLHSITGARDHAAQVVSEAARSYILLLPTDKDITVQAESVYTESMLRFAFLSGAGWVRSWVRSHKV